MNSWPLNVKEGALWDRIFDHLAETQLFAEWFNPYKIMEFNIFTPIFAILFLPYALIGVVKDIFFRKKIIRIEMS